MHEEILYIVVPDSFADEHCRSEVYHSVQLFDDLHKALQDKRFAMNQTAAYYRLLPANVHHKEGKRHFYTVLVKLLPPYNDLRKKAPDGHFAMVSGKFAKELAGLFGSQNNFSILR